AAARSRDSAGPPPRHEAHPRVAASAAAGQAPARRDQAEPQAPRTGLTRLEVPQPGLPRARLIQPGPPRHGVPRPRLAQSRLVRTLCRALRGPEPPGSPALPAPSQLRAPTQLSLKTP